MLFQRKRWWGRRKNASNSLSCGEMLGAPHMKRSSPTDLSHQMSPLCSAIGRTSLQICDELWIKCPPQLSLTWSYLWDAFTFELGSKNQPQDEYLTWNTCDVWSRKAIQKCKAADHYCHTFHHMSKFGTVCWLNPHLCSFTVIFVDEIHIYAIFVCRGQSPCWQT